MTAVRRRKFKLKISEINMRSSDREYIMNGHRHIADLHARTKTMVKDSPAANLLRDEIQNTRNELFNELAHKFFVVQVSLGPHKEKELFSYYPKQEDILAVRNKLVNRLRANKQESKTMYMQPLEFNGMQYRMQAPRGQSGLKFEVRSGLSSALSGEMPEVKKIAVPNRMDKFGGGRTFVQPQAILNMLKSPEYGQRIKRAKRPYDKSNYVGVEIELICKVHRERLDELFIESKLAGSVYVKTDSSIHPDSDQEQVITHEITLIAKQSNIADIITRVCAVLNSEEVGSYVNDTCGIHVHLDMRNRDPKKCYMNFFNALPVLVKMVPASRTKSQYCKPNTHGSLEQAQQEGDRRQAINPVSLRQHQTIELRLHSGSTNAVKLVNWVNVLTKIADSAELTTTRANVPSDLKAMFGVSDELIQYIERRTEKFKDTKINTKTDHLDMTA